MSFKPSYNFQRAERARVKKASKDAKLQDRKEQAALRKANEAAPAKPDEEKVLEPGN